MNEYRLVLFWRQSLHYGKSWFVFLATTKLHSSSSSSVFDTNKSEIETNTGSSCIFLLSKTYLHYSARLHLGMLRKIVIFLGRQILKLWFFLGIKFLQHYFISILLVFRICIPGIYCNNTTKYICDIWVLQEDYHHFRIGDMSNPSSTWGLGITVQLQLCGP